MDSIDMTFEALSICGLVTSRSLTEVARELVLKKTKGNEKL